MIKMSDSFILGAKANVEDKMWWNVERHKHGDQHKQVTDLTKDATSSVFFNLCWAKVHFVLGQKSQGSPRTKKSLVCRNFLGQICHFFKMKKNKKTTIISMYF